MTACGVRLSPEEAKQVITSSPVMQPSDEVVVERVSHVQGSADAIVHARIDGSSVTLRFRRHDHAWRWEYVEKPEGGWVRPEDAIALLREARRQKRVPD
jgi:hypothetical protein